MARSTRFPPEVPPSLATGVLDQRVGAAVYKFLRWVRDYSFAIPNIFKDAAPVAVPTGSRGTTNTIPKFTASGDFTTIDDSTITDDGTVVTINTSTEVRAVSLTSTTRGFLTVLGVLPATDSMGVGVFINGSGSGAGSQFGIQSILGDGYTGTGDSYGLYGINLSAGTSTVITGGTQRAGGNAGVFGGAVASTGGVVVGVVGYGENGGAGAAFGVVGKVAGAAGIQVGVQGNTDGGTVNVGGMFILRGGSASNPVYVSAALIADNDNNTDPIFLARDNGTVVESIQDGGQHNFTSDASRAQHTGTKALTEGAATAVVQIAVPSGTSCGVIIEWTVVANDGTDFQTRIGSTYVAIVNKAGTETAVTSDVGTSAFAESAGASTLTVAVAADATPTNAVNITINATSSLVQTTLACTYFVRKMVGTGVLIPQ